MRAFRYYQAETISAGAREFRRRHCHPDGVVEIEMIGVWDTVKALGPPYPVLSRLGRRAADFHDDRLGGHIRAGCQALALDETRTAFAPILWRREPGWTGELEQVWFPGAHGDVGGERACDPRLTRLGNISLVWMLEQAERRGRALPRDGATSCPATRRLRRSARGAGSANCFYCARAVALARPMVNGFMRA